MPPVQTEPPAGGVSTIASSKVIWQKMAERGDIYLDSYSGWYSVRDERFFTESETAVNAEGTRIATETGTPVTWTEEQTYFFRLSAYAERLLAHYEANPDFIAPEVRRNEVVSFGDYGNPDSRGRGGATPNPEIPLGWPIAVSAGREGHVYIADTLNHRVVRVDLTPSIEAECALK